MQMEAKKPLEERLIWKIPLVGTRGILVASCILITVTIFISVCMRYILKSDLFAIEEIITLVAMWLYFIGAAHGSYEDSHIKADLLAVCIKNGKALRRLQLGVRFIGMLILGIFVYWAIDFAHWHINIGGKTPVWKIPLAASKIPITLGFILMLIYSIYHFVNLLLKRERGGK